MKNTDTVTKFKFFTDLEKELAYINEMNKNGWKLVYIKWGCFYTFTKTEPDEYVTILHFEDKEKISGVAAFAAQCGYESIPHTMDGLGETLYLTGKKAEVSEDFVNDIEAKIHAQKKILMKYTVLTCVVLVIDLLLCAEAGFFVGSFLYRTSAGGLETSDIPFLIMVILFVLFTVAYTVISVFVANATWKMKKKLNALKGESEIFE